MVTADVTPEKIGLLMGGSAAAGTASEAVA